MPIRYFRTKQLPLDQLERLWRAIGWWTDEGSPTLLPRAFARSHTVVSAWDGETLVGAANAIADGHLVVYYPYVVVHPDYQRAGVGSELVRRMRARYATYHQQVLLSATGAVTFYERLGFSLSRAPGMQLEPPPQVAPESRPLLVIIRGKPGSGKTTLARRLGEREALGLPILDRDAIKLGMVTTVGAETDEARTKIVPRAFELLYQTADLWLREGVSLILESSFPRDRHEPRLRFLASVARARVITCETWDETAAKRYSIRELDDPHVRPDLRAGTLARMDSGSYQWSAFERYDVGAPALTVDTTDGYRPPLSRIIEFCRSEGSA